MLAVVWWIYLPRTQIEEFFSVTEKVSCWQNDSVVGLIRWVEFFFCFHIVGRHVPLHASGTGTSLHLLVNRHWGQDAELRLSDRLHPGGLSFGEGDSPLVGYHAGHLGFGSLSGTVLLFQILRCMDVNLLPFYWLVVPLIDWLIDWLIFCSIVFMIDQWIYRLIGWLVDCSIYWLVDWLIDWLIGLIFWSSRSWVISTS